MTFLAPLGRALQLCLVSYVAVAVLYTTQYVVLVPTVRVLYSLLTTSVLGSEGRSSVPDSLGKSYGLSPRSSDTHSAVTLGNEILSNLNWPEGLSSDELLYWPSSTLSATLGMNHSGFTPILEETFLSKAFSQSMHPTRIIPYYYKASGSVDPDDVTITTLVTSNRFKVFKQLVENYQGPISATVHIPFPLHVSSATLDSNHPSIIALRSLNSLYHSSPHFSTHVDVHLALSPFATVARSGSGSALDVEPGEGEGGRQFNVWRNVARLFARSEFVLMLDVDFAVCTDWRGAVRAALKMTDAKQPSDQASAELGAYSLGSNATLGISDVAEQLRTGKIALVVPAFEYAKQDDGLDQRTFPRSKEDLLRLVRTSPPTITSFHASWAPGHNSTDYTRYYSLLPDSGEVYKVTHYQNAYEPYVITSKRVTWCDERFTGYGGNKAACLFEMYLSGVSFYVLADHFLIHQSHKYEEEARREERKYNRKLYADFKEEACLRYIERHVHAVTLHTPAGVIVQDECKKIKNVARIAAQLVGG
ncbi:hypothetical protein OBBRIDRAFT_755913 [Obba rivulosa]|uniref:Glycosyltransferase family 49 protein n=1 Tax=Obba rivulosa TaxID=1052685 RepID=A0A8E2DNH6_9APHY|nr:hypothetical protein OBBRIDRAFT_755913 [Obba rivulosa]